MTQSPFDRQAPELHNIIPSHVLCSVVEKILPWQQCRFLNKRNYKSKPPHTSHKRGGREPVYDRGTGTVANFDTPTHNTQHTPAKHYVILLVLFSRYFQPAHWQTSRNRPYPAKHNREAPEKKLKTKTADSYPSVSCKSSIQPERRSTTGSGISNVSIIHYVSDYQNPLRTSQEGRDTSQPLSSLPTYVAQLPFPISISYRSQDHTSTCALLSFQSNAFECLPQSQNWFRPGHRKRGGL